MGAPNNWQDDPADTGQAKVSLARGAPCDTLEIPELRSLEPEPGTSPSFLLILLRALSAWST